MTKSDLESVLDESEKVEKIWKLRTEMISYFHFKSLLNMGLTFGANDLPFEVAMLYSWIDEECNSERKTRI